MNDIRNPKIKIVKEYGKEVVQIHDQMTMNIEGRLAIRLIEAYGLIAADKDSENSERQLLSPEEVVDRAFKIANLTINKIIESKLYVEIPEIPTIETDTDK